MGLRFQVLIFISRTYGLSRKWLNCEEDHLAHMTSSSSNIYEFNPQ